MNSNEMANSLSQFSFRSLNLGTSSMHKPYFAKERSSASMAIANSAMALGVVTRPRSVYSAQKFVRIWLVWESIYSGMAPYRLITFGKAILRFTSTVIPDWSSR